MRKNMFLRYLGIVSVAFLLIGCATTEPIMYKDANTFEVVGYGADKSSSTYYTKKAVEKYCRKMKKVPVIVSQETIYQGLLDEKVTEVTRRASDVTWGLGQDTASTILGGASSPTDYKTTIAFKCQ